MESGQIDGQFKVGVARTATRWLAGAGTRVFNEPEHGGYAWTSVHLTGPVDNPHEDLTPRIAAAIQQEAVDKARHREQPARPAAAALNSQVYSVLRLMPLPLVQADSRLV